MAQRLFSYEEGKLKREVLVPSGESSLLGVKTEYKTI